MNPARRRNDQEQLQLLTPPMELQIQSPIPDEIEASVSSPWEVEIPEDQKMKILNAKEFQIGKILNAMGIADSPLRGSFGLSSKAAAEIQERLELCKFLDANRKNLWPIIMGIHPSGLPRDYKDFLEYHATEGPNPYWKQVHTLVESMKNTRGTPPKKLRDFVSWIQDTAQMEDAEDEMTAIAIDTIKSAVVMEGVLTAEAEDMCYGCEITITFEEEHTWGYQKYSSTFMSGNGEEYSCISKRLKNSNGIVSWIGSWLQETVDQRNRNRKSAALRARAITKAPESLLREIRIHLRDKLILIPWNEIASKALPDQGRREISNARMIVYYVYSQENGLHVEIRHIAPINITCKAPEFEFVNFGGYDEKHKENIMQVRATMQQCSTEAMLSSASASIRKLLVDHDSEFFKMSQEIPSEETDENYSRHALPLLWSGTGLGPVHESCEKHRRTFFAIIQNLQSVVKMLRVIAEKRKNYGYAKRYPEISWGANAGRVSFEKIYPIQLLDKFKASQLVPITGLPPIAGSMIGFTGKHGEGKTTVLEAILAYVYLGQSGIPIFGKEFRMALYDTLGMIFLARGDGSTCQLIVQEVEKLIRHLDENGCGRAFVVLDELGTGTQESAGLKFGQEVLEGLKRRNVSVVFSTQITALAKHMKNQGIEIFQVNQGHEIKPGIGTGKLDELVEESGLGKLLKQR